MLLRRRRHLAAFALLALFAATACADFDPYVTVARAGKPDQPIGDRVGICYNAATASSAEVIAQAQQACTTPGATAQRVDTDYYLQACPLLLPARATFVCVPPKK